MDFVAARLLDGRWFRVLTVVDQFTRECVCAAIGRQLAQRIQGGARKCQRETKTASLAGVKVHQWAV